MDESNKSDTLGKFSSGYFTAVNKIKDIKQRQNVGRFLGDKLSLFLELTTVVSGKIAIMETQSRVEQENC